MRTTVFMATFFSSVAFSAMAFASLAVAQEMKQEMKHGLNKHDQSIATYGYAVPIVTNTSAATSSSLKDDLDRGAVAQNVPSTLPQVHDGVGTIDGSQRLMPPPRRSVTMDRGGDQGARPAVPLAPSQQMMPPPAPPQPPVQPVPQMAPQQPTPQPVPQVAPQPAPAPAPQSAPVMSAPPPQDEMLPKALQQMRFETPLRALPPSHPDFGRQQRADVLSI